MSAVHDGTANININNVINVVNCIRCKWFTGLVYEDIDIVFGLCKATEDDIIMTEDDAFEDEPCDLYDDNSYDDTTA